MGGDEANRNYGTADYNDAPVSLEEYVERAVALGDGDVEQYARVPQPAYINGNIYLGGAEAFSREHDKAVSDLNPELAIVTEEDGVYLNITLPEDMADIASCKIDTEMLGMTRITEARYENPDGSPVVIDYDLLGNSRSEDPAAGPLEQLAAGRNHVFVWKK